MKTSDKVIRCAEEQPYIVNNDKELLLAVWEVEGLSLSKTQKQIFLTKCTTAESITRKRRELITDGVIKPHYDITKARKERQIAIANRYRERSPRRPLFNGRSRELFDPLESN